MSVRLLVVRGGVLAFVVVLGACGGAYGSSADDGPDGGAPDGGSCIADLMTDPQSCGACHHACANGETCAAGVCATAACDVLYVAPGGDDARSGCSAGDAKRTLGNAIARAKAMGAGKREIHACAGIYTEANLTIDAPVSLLGGYACRTFERSASFGYPVFDATNETIIENAAPTVRADTLVVSGAAIGASVRIEGLTIRGAVEGSASSTALLLAGRAAPSVSNCEIFGGVAPGQAIPFQTVGLRTTSGAAPDIASNRISGGAGKSENPGVFASIGLLIGADSAGPHVHGNTIVGGSGLGTTCGSAGLASFTTTALTGALAIEGNTIDGGIGATSGDAQTIVGVWLPVNTPATLLGNQIRAGAGSCIAGPCRAAGVLSAASPLRLERNRIYGGDLVASSSPASTAVVVQGVVSYGGGPVLIDNMIHAGDNKGVNLSLPGQNGFAVGVLVGSTTKDGLIAHNTMVMPHIFVPAPVVPGYLVFLDGAGHGTRVENNLLVGGDNGTTDFGVVVTSATGGSLGSLQNNAFVALATPFRDASSGGVVDYASISASEAAQNGFVSGSARANVLVAKTCDASDDATRCAAPAACSQAFPGCVRSVLASFDSASTGYDDLIGAGYRLREHGGLCLIMNGGHDLRASVPTDFFGTARAAMPSMGAHEDHVCDP